MKQSIFEVPHLLSIESWRVPVYLKDKSWRQGASLAWAGIILLIFLFLIGIAALIQPIFYMPRNLSNIAGPFLILALASVGASLLYSQGGADLSMGATGALAGIIAFSLSSKGIHPVLGISLGLVTALVIGFINGSLTSILRLPGILVTGIALFGVRGLNLLLSSARGNFMLRSGDISFTLVALFGWIVLAGAFILVFILLQIPASRAKASAKPGEESFARRALRIGWPYVLSAGLAGLAGIIFSVRIQMASSVSYSSMEIQALIAVIIGGGIFGARSGNPLGALLAALFIVMLENLLNLLGMSAFIMNILLASLCGAFLILRPVFDYVVGRMYASKHPV